MTEKKAPAPGYWYKDRTYFVIVYLDAATGEIDRGSIAYRREPLARKIVDVLNSLSEEGATTAYLYRSQDREGCILQVDGIWNRPVVHYVEPVVCAVPYDPDREPDYMRINYRTDPPTLTYLAG